MLDYRPTYLPNASTFALAGFGDALSRLPPGGLTMMSLIRGRSPQCRAIGAFEAVLLLPVLNQQFEGDDDYPGGEVYRKLHDSQLGLIYHRNLDDVCPPNARSNIGPGVGQGFRCPAVQPLLLERRVHRN